jgi:hypothetical protein
MAWQIVLVVVGVNVRKEENHVVRTVFYHGPHRPDIRA